MLFGSRSLSFPALSASVLLFCPIVLAAMAKPSAPDPAQPALLPTDFAGWSLTAPASVSSAPETADAGNAAILKEYGFQEFASAHYVNGTNKLAIRAIRFQDASGAFGAFTFFRQAGSLTEEIGRGAAFDGTHVLFWAGSTVVQGTFDQMTPMSPAELRELAKDVPAPSGSANVAPSLPGFLPRQNLQLGQSHYALGPEAYTRSGGVLPAPLVDFGGTSAEAITADYSARDGNGQVTLLMYPTPQLAAARLRAIDAFIKAGNGQSTWPQPLAESRPGSLLTRRSGPILAISSGGLDPALAKKLVNQVNYRADVTWNNPNGYIGDGTRVARLLVGIITLAGILCGAALLLGIFLGGGRALVRMAKGKPASAFEEQNEIIRLNLDD